MKSISISMVSYLNSILYRYGLEKSGLLAFPHSLSLDNPAQCAHKLTTGESQIGLVPVGAFVDISGYQIICNYGLAARGPVKTVVIASEKPLHELDSIFLDYQSRSSVLLAQILNKFFWKYSIQWIPAKPGYEEFIKDRTGGVIIGDRVFTAEKKFKYITDLSESWMQYTGLPFVFAAWISNTKIDNDILNLFNQALTWGLNRKEEGLSHFNLLTEENIEYLSNNIVFHLDEECTEAILKFKDFQSSL